VSRLFQYEYSAHRRRIPSVDASAPVDSVIGHSMGAGAGALAVMEGLDVKCAVLVAGAYPAPGLNRWRRNAERQGLSPETADAAKHIYDERVGPDRVTGFNLREQLGDLRCAVLLIHSQADEHIPIGEAEAAAAKNAHVELRRVEALSHRQTARDPSVCAAIADFVLKAANDAAG
jgi:pimeloyl-ACP methyl ester carboxylesterase